MTHLVTGAAGFIGSHLAEALLDEGHDVVGVDADLDVPRARAGFRFLEADLRDADLDALLEGIEVVYHQAAQPGVRLSGATRGPTLTATSPLPVPIWGTAFGGTAGFSPAPAPSPWSRAAP